MWRKSTTSFHLMCYFRRSVMHLFQFDLDISGFIVRQWLLGHFPTVLRDVGTRLSPETELTVIEAVEYCMRSCLVRWANFEKRRDRDD